MSNYSCYVDADLLVYRFAFSGEQENPLTGKKELVEPFADTAMKIDTFIQNLKDIFRDMNFIFILSGGKNFRHDIATVFKYKENRKEKPILFTAIRQYLVMQHKAIVTDGVEADDYISTHYRHYGEFGDVIMSIDKDFKMIPGVHYNWDKDLLYIQSQGDAVRHFYKQVLEGDRADNIPSLYHLVSVGEYGITAAKKLSRCAYKRRMNTFLDKCEDEYRMFKYIRRTASKYGAKLDNVVEVCHLLYLQNSFKDSAVWKEPTQEARRFND